MVWKAKVISRISSGVARPSVHTKKTGGLHGFTLLEILLVVTLMVIVAGMIIPAFSRSYHAANMRSASRSVITATRYARAMAVLQQRQVAVFFNSHTGVIDVVTLEPATSSPVGLFSGDERSLLAQDLSHFNTTVLRSKSLPDQVQIIDFSVPNDMQESEGVYWVNYFPSGMNDSFALRLADQRKSRVLRIEVNHLAGITKVHHE